MATLANARPVHGPFYLDRGPGKTNYRSPSMTTLRACTVRRDHLQLDRGL
jgi:hypothetical protein